MNWSNPTRPEEETTKHPNKFSISHGNNYFSQPGGEATEPNPTQNKSFLTQETLSGGDDTKQKTEIEATLNEGDNRRETTEKSKKTISQNPDVEKTTKTNPVQILLSGHSKEGTNEDILQMFNQNKAPEINRRGNYTILQFKDKEAAREGITSIKMKGETGDTQIKTKMYHPLLNDLYNIPSPKKNNKPNNTST